MNEISAAELGRIRAVQAEMMPDSCTRVRLTNTPNSRGGFDPSEATATYACRLALPRSQRDVILAEKLTTEAVWTLTLPYGADVLNEDLVRIGGTEYQVIHVMDAGSYSTAVRVMVIEAE